ATDGSGSGHQSGCPRSGNQDDHPPPSLLHAASARGVVGVGPDQRHEAARTKRLGDPRAAGEPEAGELLALVAAADRAPEAASLAELPGQGEREARSRGADRDGVEGRPLWRAKAAVAGE